MVEEDDFLAAPAGFAVLVDFDAVPEGLVVDGAAPPDASFVPQ